MSKGIRIVGDKYRWELCYKGKRVSGTEYSEEDAITEREKKLKELKEAYMAQFVSGDNALTLVQALEREYNANWINNKSAKSALSIINGIKTYFKNKPLSEINTEVIDSYIETMKEHGLSGGTINRHLSALSKTLRHCYRRGEIDRMPYLEHQRESKGRIRYLTQEEETKVLEYIKNDKRFTAIVITLIDTGIRCGELLKLKKEEIIREQGVNGILILNDTKNGTNRSVPLTKRARKAIDYLSDTSTDPEQVITEEYHNLYLKWKELRTQLGYANDPDFVLHMLRHTCASRLVQKGASIKKVQNYMGHSNINTTLRYAHLSPTDLYDMCCLLE